MMMCYIEWIGGIQNIFRYDHLNNQSVYHSFQSCYPTTPTNIFPLTRLPLTSSLPFSVPSSSFSIGRVPSPEYETDTLEQLSGVQTLVEGRGPIVIKKNEKNETFEADPQEWDVGCTGSSAATCLCLDDGSSSDVKNKREDLFSSKDDGTGENRTAKVGSNFVMYKLIFINLTFESISNTLSQFFLNS